jgi:hypothetical protein
VLIRLELNGPEYVPIAYTRSRQLLEGVSREVWCTFLLSGASCMRLFARGTCSHESTEQNRCEQCQLMPRADPQRPHFKSATLRSAYKA